MDALDVVIAVLVVAAVGMLVYSASHPVKESFTELYFENHTLLPRFAGTNATFTFTTHNLEQQPFTYRPVIVIEYPKTGVNHTAIVPDQLLQNDEYRTITWTAFFDAPFTEAKVRVLLPEKGQDIHFWVKYASKTYTYGSFGEMGADCVPVNNATPGQTIIFAANASEAEGWPLLQAYVDGANVSSITIDSAEVRNYTLSNPFGPGEHLIDLYFTNDYYNKTSGLDRNVFFHGFWLDGQYMNNTIIDSGSGRQSFDCEKAAKSLKLGSNGALRLRLDIADATLINTGAS
ncbi:MAG: carbohydrate-binding domain-containing protein [Nanoarchaeota archaeon]